MKNILKYKRPAESWEKGMAIGNGRIGAMLLGGTREEHIWLNEDTLWSGCPCNYNDPEVYRHLLTVQRLIFDKKYTEAEDIINKHMVGIWNESYLPMGDLYLSMPELGGKVESYERQLDISRGISCVRMVSEGISYDRSAFCSCPDQVMVIRLKASEEFRDVIKIRLSSQLKHWITMEKDGIRLNGWCPTVVEPDYYPAENPVVYDSYEETQAIKFEIYLKVLTDGKIECKEEYLEVRGGREISIVLTSANSFRSFDKIPDAPFTAVTQKTIENAYEKTYEELLERHIQDFASLFDRVELDLGHTENEELYMEDRQQRMFDGEEDPELLATAFQFGRYLMISGSREGTQPLNLQGIWNNEIRPPWSSNYTVNINTQMNYWPADVCNLPECMEPYIRFMEEIRLSGRETARINYHCRGWAAHHNIDLWRKTTAVGSRKKEIDVLPWSFWLMSGGWLCRQLWEHYLFTQDKEFLREKAFPVMKECAEFYLDFLVEYQGELVINPSTSPENLFIDAGEKHGISYACTLDNSILKELFQNCLSAMICLGMRDMEDLEKELKTAIPKIPVYKVGKYGQLQEWYEDFEENDPEHRHLSLLYALYPSDLITVEKTPDLAKACRETMKRRGEGSVPWSRAWKIGIYARLKDGEKAYQEAVRFLQPADSNEISYDDGGVYNNLFCARPLEVDGNFGFTACVAEMLVQSHADKTELLPAIPKAWKEGYIKGLRIRGNQEVEIRWETSENGRKQFHKITNVE